MTVCFFIALLFINAFMITVMGYSLVTVAQGVYENIANILDSIMNWIYIAIGSYLIFS